MAGKTNMAHVLVPLQPMSETWVKLETPASIWSGPDTEAIWRVNQWMDLCLSNSDFQNMNNKIIFIKKNRIEQWIQQFINKYIDNLCKINFPVLKITRTDSKQNMSINKAIGKLKP